MSCLFIFLYTTLPSTMCLIFRVTVDYYMRRLNSLCSPSLFRIILCHTRQDLQTVDITPLYTLLVNCIYVLICSGTCLLGPFFLLHSETNSERQRQVNCVEWRHHSPVAWNFWFHASMPLQRFSGPVVKSRARTDP